jgi:CO dehydrogenase nickel-insertion accessory protein CooC1
MNVLAFASRKGGAGKSTLAAHLAVHVYRMTRACLLVDDDPQGSLTLWNELRAEYALPLKTVKRGIAQAPVRKFVAHESSSLWRLESCSGHWCQWPKRDHRMSACGAKADERPEHRK